MYIQLSTQDRTSPPLPAVHVFFLKKKIALYYGTFLKKYIYRYPVPSVTAVSTAVPIPPARPPPPAAPIQRRQRNQAASIRPRRARTPAAREGRPAGSSIDGSSREHGSRQCMAAMAGLGSEATRADVHRLAQSPRLLEAEALVACR
eukprot:SAG31_NODE_356_length_17180_cov_7.595925_3_plen_147_part_00